MFIRIIASSILTIFLLTSCGVKGPPVAPMDDTYEKDGAKKKNKKK